MGLRLLLVGFLLAALSDTRSSAQHGTANPGPGSEACARCHSEIYNSYQKTVMATASGNANHGVITGEFEHSRSGVHYRVFQKDGNVWMSYERTGEKKFRGQRKLLYFIGSGIKGRSYLFSVDGFLFETPINWYSQEHRWNMTPAYTEARESPMNLPAFVDCLNCHTSGLGPPLPGTDSGFPDKPFLHDGITCERCHGTGEGHLEGKGPIVNPAKLSPERRDAICMECHFEGTVTVEQAGKRLYQFQPGERLADYIHYFLLPTNHEQSPRALSQFEALSMSACRRKSGDSMWCGTCHDPHYEPSVSEKAGYYSRKCITCHSDAFARKHHPDKPDCTHCHMPALPSQDVAHTESTDHRILRYPFNPQLVSRTAHRQLVPFPPSAAPLPSTRDLALAWETLAQRGVDDAVGEAEANLDLAVKENPDDPVLLSAMGYIEQQHGNTNEARDLYERALKIDPLLNDAATNLGILDARSGNLRQAVALWQQAFRRVPNQSAIGLNLAIAFCAAGQLAESRTYVERVLEFNPDLGKAKQLWSNLNSNPPQCKF
jgi:hypothetical protein